MAVAPTDQGVPLLAAIEVANWPLENMRPSMSTTTSPVARTPPLTRTGCGVAALKVPGRLAATATRPSEPVTYWITRRLVPSYTSRRTVRRR